MKIWTDLSSVLSHSTRIRQTTDGRTDRILIARPRLHCVQRGKKVKEQWHGKFYLQSVWRKTCYFWYRITKLETN